jgi:N-carbamoyl-L-amino-acid hydrolase
LLLEIKKAVSAIAQKRRVNCGFELLNADDPAPCDAHILDALRESCKEESVTHMEMVSRAYHDTLFMTRIAPARHAVHPVPRRNQPSPRRVCVAA